MAYELGEIRKLLKAALTDNELADLLFDKFPSVNDETSGQTPPDRRRKLVEYANKKREIPELLDSIKGYSPAVYEEFKDKLVEQEPISPSLQVLAQILTSIDFGTTVIKTYRLSLPEIRNRQTPETLDALLRLIADIPGQPDEPKPLWRFVNFLIQDKSLDPNCQKDLKDWAKIQGITLDSTSKPVHSKSETGETYLMIKVKLHPPDKYIVSAAIVEDPDPLSLRFEAEKVTSIDIPILPDPTCAPNYTQDQLPLILSELISICGGKGYPLTDLIVQWFLPIELMSLPLEYWQIKTGKQQNPPNGIKCKAVIVCSSDRHFSSEYQSVLGDWKKYWQRLLDSLESKSCQALDHLDPTTGKAEIVWSKTNVVGCKFIEPEDRQQRADFWDNLFSQGSPIALWSRQPVANQQETMAIIDTLTNCSLAVLPVSLTDHRKEVLPKMSSTTTTSQPVAQLSLMWDNPFRGFPEIEYDS